MVEKQQKAPKRIMFYRPGEPNGFMSNFYPSPINIDGKQWPTTEHYFQAMKFPDHPQYQEEMRIQKAPGKVFFMGKARIGIRPDWD